MATTILSDYDIKRIQIKNIASKILQSDFVWEKIEGKKYRFHIKKGIVYVKNMKFGIIVNSEMSYYRPKGNEFNNSLYLAKIVKITYYKPSQVREIPLKQRSVRGYIPSLKPNMK